MLTVILLGGMVTLAILLTAAVWMLIDFAKDYTWHDTKGGW